ncbi:MAG TPA: ATP-binding protein [Oleiagrimonas sp.]|nr:ATP-binding protein [Oleiagrimonas sp.]
MATEPSARLGRMPRFERRVLYGSLLVALPGLLALVVVEILGVTAETFTWIMLAVVFVTVALARWQYRRLVFPLYTLSGLLEALREGDYSLRGAAGNVLGDVVYDVNALAERLQNERIQYEESTHLLGKTLSTLDSAVFVFDERLRLRLINPAGQRLLHAEHHRLFGRSAEELGLATLLEGAPSQVRAHVFPQRGGRFDIRHATLRRDGRGGKLLVVNDVGHVLREEERQAWQRLLRVLGHEVNNSLAPIQSMAGTLATLVAREPLPEDWREDFASGLNVIEKRAGALSRFLSGYATLARLPSPRLAEVDLPALLHKVTRLESRVPVTLEEGEPLDLRADADQLEQALINLVRNAAEASLEHAGSVRVRWLRDQDRVVVEVDDDGSGLPTSDNLFVPFFTTKPGGSGIGLALVRQIAEAHDGGVSLHAREGGHGVRATLWLPVADAQVRQGG